MKRGDQGRPGRPNGGARIRRQARPGARAVARAAVPADQERELAHDLTEGLGTIAMFAGALELDLGGDLDPAVARNLDGIRDGLDRMNSLITATLRAGGDSRAGDSHRPVDTNKVVREARANIEARTRRTGARIVCEPLPWVHGDAAGLTRLFQNLLANAIEHRHPRRLPRVRIGARPGVHGWLFEVADNGRGMNPALADRALEPAHLGPVDGPDGRPQLGLGICASILAEHGGRASAQARPEGGTVVAFELPRVPRGLSVRARTSDQRRPASRTAPN